MPPDMTAASYFPKIRPTTTHSGDQELNNIIRTYEDSLWDSPALSFDTRTPLAYSIRKPRLSTRDSSILVNSDEAHGRRITTYIKHHPTVLRKQKRRNRKWTIAVLTLVLVIAISVAVTVPLLRSRQKNKPNSSTTAAHGPGSVPTTGPVKGSDGTLVRTETGDTFVYRNSFGGFFVDDPNDAFNSDAQAQSWSPPLTEAWDWGNDIIRG
jgi:hypothetical protein